MIRVDRDGAVAVVTIDDHARRNAIDEARATEIYQVFSELGRQAAAAPEDLDGAEPVRAIVLTGGGTAFCAGADIKGGVYSTGFYEAHAAALRVIESIPVPVIAYVNGPAVGAGVQLALAADLRVVDPSAAFAVPVVKIGLALDTWTVRRLAAIVGGGHARGALYTGRIVTPADAEKTGLANEIGGRDEALALAREIAAFAPLTLRHLKAVFNDDSAREQSEEHDELMRAAWHSDDSQEARRAREEKRRPEFKGR